MSAISLPIEDAAAAVGLSRRYLDSAIRDGDLVARRAGKKVLIGVADLEAWFASLPLVERKAAS